MQPLEPDDPQPGRDGSLADPAAGPPGVPRIADHPSSLDAALVHLYRADVGRAVAFRQRLDTTTNWAISLSVLVSTFVLGNPAISHAAFLFLMLATTGFLSMEARRFHSPSYAASRRRLLLMERTFSDALVSARMSSELPRALVPLLRGEYEEPSSLALAGWRLRRVYLWIYAGLLGGWLSKLNFTGAGTWNAAHMVGRAAVGAVPGPAVCAGVGLFYITVCCLAITGAHPHAVGDDELGR
jgi:uncharacterized membrane protein